MHDRGDEVQNRKTMAGTGPALRSQARQAFGETVRAGAGAYDRMRDLPGLIRLDAFARQAGSESDIAGIVARLERALRAERSRGRSGHWTYDLNRHIGYDG